MVRVVTLLLYDLTLILLAVEDFKFRRIRNRYSVFILLLSVMAVIIIPEITVTDRFLGILAVGVPMFLLRKFVKGSFGGGDVKLCFACGAFLGIDLLLKGTILAIFLAGIYAVYLLISRKERQFPLGPFLAIGFLITTRNL